MLKIPPSFLRLILHEVQDNQQHFWNLVQEADYSGERFLNAELKNLLFDEISSETAATLRIKQSEQTVKTRWVEVEGFDASADKFLFQEALQKCSPTSFLKVKFTEDTWKNRFHLHEDRTCLSKAATVERAWMGSASWQATGCFCTPRRNSGKR